MCANVDIRRDARANGVPFWKISRALSISEPTMTRRLRVEMEPDDKERIRAIIRELAKEAD